MSSVLAKVSRSFWVAGLCKRTRNLFNRYLLVTNTVVSVGFSGTGDILQQYHEKFSARRQRWDLRRTVNISSSGLIVGPICHFWYLFLDRVLPGTSLRVVLKKVIADQIVISPICVFAFLVMVGYAEGATRRELGAELTDKGPTLLKAEMLVWPPAQLLNFMFLPTRFRVLYDNIVSLGFDVYYSYIKYREDTPRNSNQSCDLQKLAMCDHQNIEYSQTFGMVSCKYGAGHEER